MKQYYCIYEDKPHVLRIQHDSEKPFIKYYCSKITSDFRELGIPNPALKPLPVVLGETLRQRYFNEKILPVLYKIEPEANVILTFNKLWMTFIEFDHHELLTKMMANIAWQLASMKHPIKKENGTGP